jgi:hypothetical protein
MWLALACVITFGALAIAYRNAKAWDRAWAEERQRRHRRSLTTLRERLRRSAGLMAALFWFMVVAGMASVAVTGLIYSRLDGDDRGRMLALACLPILILFLAAGLCLLGIRLARYMIRRLDALTGGNVIAPGGR